MSPPPARPLVRRLAEAALLVDFGGGPDPATTARVVALTAALDAAAARGELLGLLDLVPAYTTVLLTLDPSRADPAAVVPAVERLAAETGLGTTAATRTVTLPVVYGGEGGPDLADVAAHAGLDPTEVAARHAAGSYLVACLGFSPGFAFLLGLPPELATPRLTSPRTRVPVGSVGIGGAQTGVYPLETPGGWRLIGRTGVRLFDPAAADPFLLRVGDRVRFAAVSSWEQAAAATITEHDGDRS